MATHTVWPLWIFCLCGLAVLPFGKRHRHALAFVLLALFGAAATVPGFYFRSQYFVMLLPGLCLLGGLFLATVVDWMPDRRLRYLPVLVPLIMLATFFYQLRSYYFFEPSPVAVRQLYGINPLAESIELADWLDAHSDPEDRLAVLGSEPQIYFYSRRPAATGYIYAYPLLEQHDYAQQMTQEMIAEVEAANPEWVVFTNVWTSWLKQSQGTTEFERWVAQYRQQYDPVLLIEIYHDRQNRRFLNNTIVVDPEVKAQRKYPGAPFIALYRRHADK